MEVGSSPSRNSQAWPQVLQKQVQEPPQGDGFGRNLGIWSKVPHIPPPWCEHELWAVHPKMMKGAPMRISRRDKLVILQDLSRVHTSKKTQAFFKKHQLNPLLLPGNSLDYRTMEKIVLHLLTPFSSQAILLTATLSSIVSPWSRGSWRRSPRGTWPRWSDKYGVCGRTWVMSTSSTSAQAWTGGWGLCWRAMGGTPNNECIAKWNKHMISNSLLLN